MSSQKRDREYDDEEDAGGAAYRGLGAAMSPHRDYDDDGDQQTEDDDEEMRDLEDSDDDDLAFFGGGPVSSDSVSDSWLSAALLEGQQELANALEPLGSLAVAWATPSGDLSAGFVRLDFNLLLLSTSFDRRAADCLGLRLERPLRVTLSFDAPHGTTTPDPLVPLEVVDVELLHTALRAASRAHAQLWRSAGGSALAAPKPLPPGAVHFNAAGRY